MESVISILIVIVTGLGYMLFRKYKQNRSLKADVDLTSQEKDSKIVDEKVSSAQEEIDALSQEKKAPVKESEEFWKDYSKNNEKN